MDKLYVVTYHEVQIAGYRIFTSYDSALKEYLKHCILETQALMIEEEEEENDSSAIENLSSETDEDADLSSEDEDQPGVDEAAEDETTEDDDDYDEMSCIFEIQELQGDEFVTVKEFDYEVFEKLLDDLLDDKNKVSEFLSNLEKHIENNEIPDNVLSLFK